MKKSLIVITAGLFTMSAMSIFADSTIVNTDPFKPMKLMYNNAISMFCNNPPPGPGCKFGRTRGTIELDRVSAPPSSHSRAGPPKYYTLLQRTYKVMNTSSIPEYEYIGCYANLKIACKIECGTTSQMPKSCDDEPNDGQPKYFNPPK